MKVSLEEIRELEAKLTELREKFLLERGWESYGEDGCFWRKGNLCLLTDEEAVSTEE